MVEGFDYMKRTSTIMLVEDLLCWLTLFAVQEKIQK